MKKFNFPLSRAMDWRRTQARIEELKLEQLCAEMRGIDTRAMDLDEARAKSERTVIARPESTGAEMAALGSFQRFTIAEQGRLAAKRVECVGKIATQTQAVAARRKDVRLIEMVKERRFEAWRADFEREIDAQAEEAYLAKWNRGD